MACTRGHFEGERLGTPFPIVKKPQERMGINAVPIVKVSEERQAFRRPVFGWDGILRNDHW